MVPRSSARHRWATPRLGGSRRMSNRSPGLAYTPATASSSTYTFLGGLSAPPIFLDVSEVRRSSHNVPRIAEATSPKADTNILLLFSTVETLSGASHDSDQGIEPIFKQAPWSPT